MKTQLITLGISIALLVSCNNASKTLENKTKDKMETETVKTESTIKDLKSIVNKGQDAFFKDYNESDLRTYFNEDYIQHNPHVPAGLEPVVGFLPNLKEAGTTVKTHRLLQDGDLVVAHNSYDNAQAFGAKEIVAFDIYRVENGKIAEHWDAITPKVTETASGRSQTNGPTTITDLDKTEANKALVMNFVNDVLMGKNPSKISEYINPEKYHQHNTQVKDGLEGLGQALEYLTSQNNMFVYHKIHRIIGEGNFVLTQSEGEWNGGKPHAYYDLFRIEDGKLVEHWDIIQEIPAEQAHSNTMF
ncbi:MAG: nuclear transport factor 2 family protein [Winogradskyella sp.]|uniref:nuclear transport factor 2 family protein n=1 Tax=Winogradskyella sp. TaxID=1883156 RepID=UPI0025DD5449|nr:ester cyclase [Winogradskyella sp.]NRB59074.1 nuclear transport factor 2 family protein [Winogradskyella sp.]